MRVFEHQALQQNKEDMNDRHNYVPLHEENTDLHGGNSSDSSLAKYFSSLIQM